MLRARGKGPKKSWVSVQIWGEGQQPPRMHSLLDVSWALRSSCLLPRTRSPQSPAQGLTDPLDPHQGRPGSLSSQTTCGQSPVLFLNLQHVMGFCKIR